MSDSLKKIHILIIVFSLISIKIFSQQKVQQLQSSKNIDVSFSTLFYGIDKHFIGSFIHNYGASHLIGAAGTYGIIESGFDWRWYKFSQENREIYNIGFSSVIAGALAPIVAPLGVYIYGGAADNKKLQVTALALGQAALISLAVSSTYKAVTGRIPPDEYIKENAEDNSTDFKFGFLNRGVFHGWPSGHTMTAFAMAITLTELYPENVAVQIGSITFASLIGLGVSTNIHWLSDVFAGALIGYSIGKTVGSGFNKLLNNETNQSSINFYFYPYGIGFTYQF